MIRSLEDALHLYDDAVAYRSELQEALAAAMIQLEEAMLDVHKSQDRLGEADFQLGKTRYILRKSGYGEILSMWHQISQSWWCDFHFSTDSLFLTIPGRYQCFTVKLN